MTFSKVLAGYYHKWLRDCDDSVKFCIAKGDLEGAEEYRQAFRMYAQLVADNWEAIEFFSIRENAGKMNKALPVEFRGYN